MKPSSIRVWSTLALLWWPSVALDPLEDTCEDTVLLQPRSNAVLSKGEVPRTCNETLLDAGNCIGEQVCFQCFNREMPPANNVPPTAERFPNGRLFCSGFGACEGSNFNFKNPNDYMLCEGDGTEFACNDLRVSNVGAGCCSGDQVCTGSEWDLSPRGGCQTDMCCGEFGQPLSVCKRAEMSGIETLSCRGGDSCTKLTAEVRRDVICEDNESTTCEEGQFNVSAEGDHAVNCTGPGACKSSTFVFAEKSNISFTCNGISACSAKVTIGPQIFLSGDSCIDLICSTDAGACVDLVVRNTSTDTCYFQGAPARRPRGCIQATQRMCGDIQPAEICCRASGGCADCCTTTTTSTTTSTDDVSTTSSKRPYSDYGRHRRHRRFRRRWLR